jgi:drug/metabolite transporter (DMT)-like permease
MSVLLPFALLYLSRTSFGPAGALTGLPLSQLLLLVGTGAVSALPLWLYSFGVKGLPLSLVGILQYAWPTTSLLLSLLVFRETLSPAKFLCFVTVWCGLLVFSLPSLFRRTVSTKWPSHVVEEDAARCVARTGPLWGRSARFRAEMCFFQCTCHWKKRISIVSRRARRELRLRALIGLFP